MNHRQARVAGEIRDRLAEVLTRRVRDPRLELVTITDVEISADLSFARVYYRAVTDPGDAQRALQKAKAFIRRQLAEGLPLRRVPELDFRLDETADRAARLEEVLDELKEERESRKDSEEEQE
jgi:ribosome-binding factor A